MKIFAFSDTHATTDFSHLVEKAREADVILHAGDLADFGHGLRESLAALTKLSEETGTQVMLIKGTHEHGLEEAIKEFPKIKFLNNVVTVARDIAIAGYGGGGFAHEDPRAEEFLMKANALPVAQGKKHIWLFHGPPRDMVVDVIPGYGPTGCETKAAMVQKLQPALVISGHIHEAFGARHIVGKTTLVNPGPLGMLIEV